MVEVDLKALLDPRTLVGGGLKLVERFGDEAYFAAVCIRSGMVRPRAAPPGGPDAAGLRAPRAAGRRGHHRRDPPWRPGGDPRRARRRHLQASSTSAPTRWPTPGASEGLKPGDGVAILVRNHRGFLEAVFAAAKLGAKIILLNTSFAGPQIREVAEREGTDLLVYDDEYAEVLEGVDPPHGRWRAWVDDEAQHPERVDDSLESLIADGDTSGAAAGGPRAEDRHPHQRDDRHPQGRAPRRAQVAGHHRRAAQQGAVPRSGDDRAVPSRCSTRWASPAWRSAWRWARRSSCAATSIPRPRSTASRRTRPPRSSSSR